MITKRESKINMWEKKGWLAKLTEIKNVKVY